MSRLGETVNNEQFPGPAIMIQEELKKEQNSDADDPVVQEDEAVLDDALLPRTPDSDEIDGCLMKMLDTPSLPETGQADVVGGCDLKSRLAAVIQMYLNSHVLLVITAAACHSLDVTCIRVLSKHVSIFQMLFFRSTFCTMIVYGICHWSDYSIAESQQKVMLGIARGVMGGLAYVCLAFTAYLLPLAETAFMTNSYPVVTALLAWLLGMEHLGILSWTGVIGCLIGNALMAQPPFLFGGQADWGLKRVVGYFVAIGVNLLMGSNFLLIRRIGKRIPSMVLVFYLHLCTLLICVPFLFAGFPKAANTRHSSTELLCYAGLCFTGLVVQIALTKALQVGSPTKTTAMFLTNALPSGFVGVFLLGEETSFLSIVGSFMILASVIVVVLQRSPKGDQNKAPTSENDLEQALLTDQDSET